MPLTLRAALFSLCLPCACSSSSSPAGATSSDGGGAACPDVSGTWTVTAHCDASLVGQKAIVTQTDCSLSFAAPFDGFTGTLTTDAKITLSGPQTCTGTVTASSISMMCTPGTCDVALSR
jgi:hypothetical protein